MLSHLIYYCLKGAMDKKARGLICLPFFFIFRQFLIKLSASKDRLHCKSTKNFGEDDEILQ
jgi:hypothetical protein